MTKTDTTKRGARKLAAKRAHSDKKATVRTDDAHTTAPEHDAQASPVEMRLTDTIEPDFCLDDAHAVELVQKEAELSRLAQVTEELTRTMEKTRIAEYVDYLEHPGRLIWTNFLIGVARGLGSTIGLAVVLGVFVFVVQKLILLNLPGISDFIADFILMIQQNYDLMRR